MANKKGSQFDEVTDVLTADQLFLVRNGLNYRITRENLLAGLLTNGANTFSGLLSFTGADHAGLKLNSLTTAQRNLLTPANGMIVYDTTLNKFYKYQNGAWLEMGKSTAVITIAAYNTNNGAARADYVCASDNAHTTINTAIATLPSTGGEIVFLEGLYPTRATIDVPDNVTLTGKGRGGASKIFKVIDGYDLVTVQGSSSSTSNYARGVSIRNLTFEGNNKTGTLLKSIYNQTMFVSNCQFDGSAGSAIELTQTQDSYFHQVTMNSNHSLTEPVMLIRGGPGGSANMLWFNQVRIEDYWYRAILMQQGSGYAGNNNGFFFSQCKFESASIAGDHAVEIDSSYLEVHFNQIFGSIGGFKSGWSTASNFIYSYAKGLVSFRDISVNAPTGKCNSVLKLNALNGTVVIDNILMDGVAVTSDVIFDGASGGTFHIGLIGHGSGTYISGDASGYNRTIADSKFEGSLLSISSTKGVGYGAGAGGTVTQATDKSTGVTLNKTTGTITMNSAALGASTSVKFTLTNSTIAATDLVIVNIKSGGTTLAYVTQVEAVAAGSCNIILRNVSAGSLSEAVVLSFAVIKGVAA